MTNRRDNKKAIKVKIIEGKGFAGEIANAPQRAILVNETAANALGGSSIIGKPISHYGSPGRAKVVGIVKDFNFHSLHNNIEPMYLIFDPNSSFYCSLKLKGGNLPETIEFIKAKINTLSPGYPFEYVFFDEVFDRAYRSEQLLEKMFNIFKMIAITIACLGLFGIVSFAIEQRTKEIGIRKVLGANKTGIVRLISREFLRYVLYANIIAWPLAYYFMNRWIQNFAYHTNINWFVFIFSGAITLSIAIITLSYQTIKAASTNPVNSLRYE